MQDDQLIDFPTSVSIVTVLSGVIIMIMVAVIIGALASVCT